MTEQFSRKAEAWSARFSEPMSALLKRYTASVAFDQRLAFVDIQGSLAHAEMLHHVGILSAADHAAIVDGMATIRGEIESGAFTWSIDLEDVHLNIERRLTELVGDAGKRLHTARSRNDQVATDMRLWLRGAIETLRVRLAAVQVALLDLADRHADTILPGFTHMQVAQPVTFGHHLLAYVEMFSRDAARFDDCRKRVNRLPLGAAALAGTSFPIDRERVARTLGFDGVCHNSLDAVSDRDFAIEFASAASLAMMHISRLSEELVLWMSPRFGFIDIADRFCTGSSIMPQKKKPRRGRARAGQDRPRVRRPDGAADADEGPAADVQQGQPGRQGAAVRCGRHARRHARDLRRDDRRHHGEAGRDARGRAGRLRDRDRPRRLPRQEGLAVPRRARGGRARGEALRGPGGRPGRPVADGLEGSGGDAGDAIGDDVHAALTLEGSVASRSHVGGTAPLRVHDEVAAHRMRLRDEG